MQISATRKTFGWAVRADLDDEGIDCQSAVRVEDTGQPEWEAIAAATPMLEHWAAEKRT